MADKILEFQLFFTGTISKVSSTQRVQTLLEITLSLRDFEINDIFNFQEIQDSHQKWRESDFCEKSPVDSADNLQVRNFVEITLSRTVSQINVFCVLRTIQHGHQKWRENDFCKMLPVHSADTLQVQNFVEITLSCTVSKINALLCFTQKFNMATKKWRENDFCKMLPVHSADTLQVQNFVKIALSRTVSKINALLQFTKKFKMAAKSSC